MKNTSRCLLGCSLGDFGSLFFMQSLESPLPMHVQMPISVCAGLLTSLAVETVYLKRTEPNMTWQQAQHVAFGMSFISMVSMEVSMTAMEQYLTQGVLDPTNVQWWISLNLSLLVGFVTPLPYSYYQLKAHNKSCCHK